MLKRLFTKTQTLPPIMAAIILVAAADAALAAVAEVTFCKVPGCVESR